MPVVRTKVVEAPKNLPTNQTDPTELRAIIEQARAMKDARNGGPKGIADADHGFFDRARGIFTDRNAIARRAEQHHAARLPQL